MSNNVKTARSNGSSAEGELSKNLPDLKVLWKPGSKAKQIGAIVGKGVYIPGERIEDAQPTGMRTLQVELSFGSYEARNMTEDETKEQLLVSLLNEDLDGSKATQSDLEEKLEQERQKNRELQEEVEEYEELLGESQKEVEEAEKATEAIREALMGYDISGPSIHHFIERLMEGELYDINITWQQSEGMDQLLGILCEQGLNPDAIALRIGKKPVGINQRASNAHGMQPGSKGAIVRYGDDWTKREKETARLLHGKDEWSIHRIAFALGRKSSEISRVLNSSPESKTHSNKHNEGWSAEEEKQLLIYKEAKSYDISADAIGKKMGRTENAVNSRYHELCNSRSQEAKKLREEIQEATDYDLNPA